MNKHIIWEDRIYQHDEQWAGVVENHCKMNGIEFDEKERENIEWQLNEEDLEYVKANLNIETTFPIICIAEVGRWNGKKVGYKILGNNVNEIFDNHCGSDCYARYYYEKKDVKGVEEHHDGANYYTFRELKMDEDEFEEKIYGKGSWENNLYKYSKSILPYVEKFY